MIVTRLSAWPVNFTAKVVSNLQSKLHAKNLKKTRRDSNDSTMHYPTDFPIYVQIVDALDSQRGRGLTIERNQFDHACPHQPESRNTVRKSTSPANYIDWRQLSKRHKSAKTYQKTRRSGPVHTKASFSPSTLENSVFKKHRFPIAPL